MDKEKILEIGTEGGSVSFYNCVNLDKDIYTIRFEGTEGGINEEFDTFNEAITAFVNSDNSLIHFYPVYLNKKYEIEILKQINRETSLFEGDVDTRFPNKMEWEQKLSIGFDRENSDIQYFKITPLQKVEEYAYERYADDKELQKVTTSFEDKPELKIEKKGIGRISGNIFLLKNKGGSILGIYPLSQYFIEIKSI